MTSVIDGNASLSDLVICKQTLLDRENVSKLLSPCSGKCEATGKAMASEAFQRCYQHSCDLFGWK